MANRIDCEAFPTGAHSLISGEEASEEPAVQGCCNQPSESSWGRSQQQEAYKTHRDNCANGSAPETVQKLRNTLEKLNSKSKGKVEQLKRLCSKSKDRLEHLKPHCQTKPEKLAKLLEKVNSRFWKRGNSSPFRVGNWEKIQGSDDWADLLEPLDSSLGLEIIRYGNLAKATYDAFNKIPNPYAVGASTPRKNSPRNLGWTTRVREALHSKDRDCLYTKEKLFEEVGLGNLGYDIKHFLYATPKLSYLPVSKKCRKDSNWIGFVAVCTSKEEIKRLGRKDIVVAWRGTKTNVEWMKDVQCWLKNVRFQSQNVKTGEKASSGFLSMYNSRNERRYDNKSARDQALEAVKELIDKHKDEDIKLSITVTGHSLGSALATLCAFDIASEIGTPQKSRIPITVYSFAGPRVGNRAFKKGIEKRGVKVLRVVNKNDIVTRIPGRIPGTTFFKSYTHVGVQLEISKLERTTEATDRGDNAGDDIRGQPYTQPQTCSPCNFLAQYRVAIINPIIESVKKEHGLVEYLKKISYIVRSGQKARHLGVGAAA